MLKLTHIITGLNTGGAEMMLYKLLSVMDRDRFIPEVISLTDIGSIGRKIERLGVPVRALRMRRGVPNPLLVFKLAYWLKKSKPSVIQTWMYHADLIGGLAAQLAGGIPVAWGVHHSNLDPVANKISTIWTAKLCALFSKSLPVRIVCCSEATKRVHSNMGYASVKMVVIPNGFDLALFEPNRNARDAVRKELSLSENTLLIGLVARFDPQKDHHNFIKAAAIFLKKNPDVHFLLCGDQVEWSNIILSDWIDNTGKQTNFHLLGRRQDIPRLMQALDIASSSSFGEAFPLVVGEAMACGIPCVVTDVGDSALIVGDTGKVVEPRDSQALATAWQALLNFGDSGRVELGEMARYRIRDNFSLPKIGHHYENLYKEMSN